MQNVVTKLRGAQYQDGLSEWLTDRQLQSNSDSDLTVKISFPETQSLLLHQSESSRDDPQANFCSFAIFHSLHGAKYDFKS
jgi:hypothetical protein